MRSGNPLFNRDHPKDKGAHGRKAEKRTTKRLNARATPGSGALDGAKGDITYKQWLVENKATEALSFTIPLDWLAKIYGEAMAAGRSPALAIQFTTGNGTPRDRGAWVLIREADFIALTDA